MALKKKRTDLKVLKQRAADLRAEGDKLEGQITALEAKDELSEEEQSQLDALLAQRDEWETKAEATAEELSAVQADLRRQGIRDGLNASTRLPAFAVASSEPNPARTGGFRNLGDFAQTVAHALTPGDGARAAEANKRLAEAGEQMMQAAPSDYHMERGSSDGFMVPPAYRDQIYELMLEEESIANMVDTEPTESNQVGLLRDETTPWGATGIQASWRAEGSKMDPSRLATETTDVKLHELYAFVLATEELLEDAPRLASRVTRGAARALNWKRSEAVVNGTGSGQPLGWFKSPALVTVPKKNGQAGDTIVAENVAAMYARMLPSSLSRAIWLINSDAIPQLMLMTLGDQPIWTPPSTGFTNAPGGMLFGRPVMPTEHAQTLGDKGDIQFVDPKGYYLPYKASGVRFAESMHLYFDYNIRAFRWTARLGGQPFLSEPVSPAKGSATKSHFVTLAART
jgi:HK97 family phage major capsid protein